MSRINCAFLPFGLTLRLRSELKALVEGVVHDSTELHHERALAEYNNNTAQVLIILIMIGALTHEHRLTQERSI